MFINHLLVILRISKKGCLNCFFPKTCLLRREYVVASRYLNNCLQISFSKTLAIVERTDLGPELLQSALSPD